MRISLGIVGLANAGTPLFKTLTKMSLKNRKRIFHTSSADDCPIKNYFNSERYHSVKIYNNDDLESKEEDMKSVVCQ